MRVVKYPGDLSDITTRLYIESGAFEHDLYQEPLLDGRKILTQGKLAATLCNIMADFITQQSHIRLQSAKYVGVSEAGIALAVGVLHTHRATQEEWEGGWVRKVDFDFAEGRQLSGNLETGDLAILLDDCVRTGGSARRAIDVLKSNGVATVAVMSVVDCNPGKNPFYPIPLHAITTMDKLTEVYEDGRRRKKARGNLEDT
jgi:orotate phosphoribosyltransferase